MYQYSMINDTVIFINNTKTLHIQHIKTIIFLHASVQFNTRQSEISIYEGSHVDKQIER